MSLSKENAFALLLDINQNIEEYAETTVKYMIEDKKFDFLTYPPNAGLTDAEAAELNKLSNNDNLKNALRKVIADNAAGVIFNMLNLLDGASTPKLKFDNWTGVTLVDQDITASTELFNDTLHDRFFDMYWDWKEFRGQKSWKLDTYEK